MKLVKWTYHLNCINHQNLVKVNSPLIKDITVDCKHLTAKFNTEWFQLEFNSQSQVCPDLDECVRSPQSWQISSLWKKIALTIERRIRMHFLPVSMVYVRQNIWIYGLCLGITNWVTFQANWVIGLGLAAYHEDFGFVALLSLTQEHLHLKVLHKNDVKSSNFARNLLLLHRTICRESSTA